MTIEVVSHEGTESVVVNPEAEAVNDLTEAAYRLSAEEFTALKAADKTLTLFLLLRDLAGEMRALKFKVEQYEEKGKALASPEGMQELMGKFLGGGDDGKGGSPFGGIGGLLGMLR